MILQCDQCNTKFRLDDAKLKPGGVKVRCSKCRHVFLAGAEPKQEESEFDAILSGLGAPAPEPREDAVAPAAGVLPAGLNSDGHPGAVPGAFSAATPPPAAPGPQAVSLAAEATVADPALPGTPKQSAPQAEVSDFSSFDFPSEPFQSPVKPAAAPPPVTEFSPFDLPPELPPQEPQASSPAKVLDYDEFSFDEEPAPLREEPTAASEEALDFGEFSFAEEPAPSQEKSAPDALDFGDFDFEVEPAPKPQPPAAPDDLDYGDFSFAAGTLEEPAPATSSAKAAAAVEEGLDFADFTFSEEPPPLLEEPAQAAKEGLDFGEFSFNEEPVQPKEERAPAAVAAQLPFSEPLPAKASQPAPPASDGFNFDEFSFAPSHPPRPATTAGAVAPPADAGRPAKAAEHGPAATAAPLPLDGEAAFDFGMGTVPVPTRVPDQFELDEEALPPLSIVSRRKGRSLLTIAIIAFSILVILALSGAGFYLLQSGPAAFDKLGLGFVAKWFGMESAEEGRITIRNQQASFIQNKEAGELFVVTGEAVNSFRRARASIHVRVSLFDKKGAVLVQKTAYCGNRLSDEQLATLPMAKIESTMNNQFGDSLSNLGVQPDKAIGFVVAIPNVPKEAADFGVEVIGSTVAEK